MCDSATPRLKARLYLSSPTEVCVLSFCLSQKQQREPSSAVKSVRVPQCESRSCLPCIKSLVGHVAYVSLTLWVTEPPPPLSDTLHPFSSNMQVCTAEREREGGGGDGGGACRFMIIPKQMLLLKTL